MALFVYIVFGAGCLLRIQKHESIQFWYWRIQFDVFGCNHDLCCELFDLLSSWVFWIFSY